ncbi:hypothetical protein FACS189413_19680 [Bacteroidia bacterium]|nr:hypothetical protein FACS189413_19680 [Bacteroidia bacterium]
MKQLNAIILLITTSILLCACPDKDENGHRYITFVNKSGKFIACQEFWSGHITDADTLFQCRIAAFGIPVDSLCSFYSLNQSGWETDFEAIPCIQFLIMDGDIYKEYITPPDCDTIRKYVPILHCYRLTLEDLQRMNWRVVYPPKE